MPVARRAGAASPRPLQVGRRVLLRRLVAADRAAYITGVRAGRALYRGWVSPPDSAAGFARLLARADLPTRQTHLVCRREDGALCGIFNLSEIVRGPFHSCNLGYFAFGPLAGQGYMREGMALLLRQGFARLKLHRIECNVQPGNVASLRLALGAGFRPEGYSPRYLKIGGRWRDHLRLALLAEDWRGRRG